MPSTIIISHYPISNQRKQEASEIIGEETDTFVVSNIVHDGYINLACQLRSIRYEKVIILINSRGPGGMLPVLRFMALLMMANQRFVLTVDNQLCRWRSSELIYDILNLASSWLTGIAGMAIASSILSEPETCKD